jgi:ribosomal-protein-alanine N-acetyltransferase
MQPRENNQLTDPSSLFILETARLILRRQTMDDVPFLIDLWSDPEITRYVGGPREAGFLKETFEDTARNPFTEKYDLWVTVEKESGKPVGYCGLVNKEVEGRMEYELSYFFAKPAWGKGYATEMGAALVNHARREFGLKRIIALVDPANQGSCRVAEKSGMKAECEIVRPGAAPRILYALE